MKKTCYNLTAFNLNDALSGGLCMALNSAFTPTGPICDYIPASPNPESTPYIPRDYMKKNEYVLGVGVCKYESPYLLINIENDTYVFDENGNGVTEIAKYYKLWMATVVNLDGDELDEKYEGTPDAGLDVDIYTHSFNEGGYLNIINEQTTKRVSNLTTRDKFATSILQGILGKISDPAALSISEIQFYCEAAYKWADSMLLSAASRRSECSQYWKNDTMHDVSGNPVIMYVESWRNLVDSEGHGYNSEEEAVEDGWVFYPAVDDNIPTLESTIKKKLDEVTEAISNIESGGGGGGGTDVSGIVTQLTAIKNKLEDFYTYRGTYSYPLYIQNKRGDSSNNPIYISGGGSTDVSGIVSALNTLNSKNLFGRGGSSSSPIYVNCLFPNKSSLANISEENIKFFLTFNSDGAPGYSTIQDTIDALTAEGFTTASSPSRMYKFILGDVGYIGWQESGSGDPGQLVTDTVEVSSGLIRIKGAYIDFENPNGGGLRILPNYYSDYAAAFHSDDSLYAFDNFEEETQFVIDCTIEGQCTFRADNFIFATLDNSGPANITADYIYCSGVNPESDRDLKEDIEDISLSCEDIAKMPAVSFVFKDDSKKRKNVGSIAQDWETILPEAISKNPRGNLCMNYSGAAMVSVISLAKELKALKEEVAFLKEEIVELKNSK